MSKKVLIFIVIVLVLGAGYYYKDPQVFKSFFGKKLPTQTAIFAGDVEGVSNNQLKLRGIFTAPEGLKNDFPNQREMTFILDGSTTYKKTEVSMPSGDFLKATGNDSGIVDVKTFARKESVGSNEDLKKSVSESGAIANLTFDYTNGNLTNIVAKEVAYIVVVYPRVISPTNE